MPAGPGGGDNLPSSAIGDPVKGEFVFEAKRCADCHAYDGKGGGDAPPLDFMKGRLSAREIADRAGTLWNHLPQMLPHFQQEGVVVPTFADDEMADLIAYLHGAPAADAGVEAPPPGHVGGEDLQKSNHTDPGKNFPWDQYLALVAAAMTEPCAAASVADPMLNV